MIKSIPVIKRKWIQDSVTQVELLDYKKYLL